MKNRVILVAGARPNFMKLAPVYRALREKGIECIIIHTGQHYDYEMSQIFFENLGIPEPDENLGVGSGSHSFQTAEIMKLFEKSCIKFRPQMVIVFGDVNSTIACALVARKLGILVSHVEAGLRSGDMGMPEEINRVLTDHISNFLFTTSEYANKNLEKEGIQHSNVYFVGNVMIDTLIYQLEKINQSSILEVLGIPEKEYDLLTLHRPSNVDNPEIFSRILDNFDSSIFDKRIIFPAHPRTASRIKELGLSEKIKKSGITIIEPLGYHDFLFLISNSRSVWTDSGGIQEETTFLNVPCFTIRENTERPETIHHGTNTLVTLSESSPFKDQFIEHFSRLKSKKEIEFWDGQSSERISDVISSILDSKTLE